MCFQLHLLIVSLPHLLSTAFTCFRSLSKHFQPHLPIYNPSHSFSVPPTHFQPHSTVSGPVNAFSAALAHFQSSCSFHNNMTPSYGQ
ncbi:hypothetical protein PAXRUDRAFT_167915 [Paxillus rubicundulus Ve08.2h10]|uniref:Secreted protein n=1 Tax=Paxillus rubicundulus Ve08.2h10 TaxID=930991 RepID=A0A0D0CP65_9AGAM|nr:hypothetical protein PAXRUDRAFT_167915 [Paxillus rubicundulus Ve08.2h10]